MSYWGKGGGIFFKKKYNFIQYIMPHQGKGGGGGGGGGGRWAGTTRDLDFSF